MKNIGSKMAALGHHILGYVSYIHSRRGVSVWQLLVIRDCKLSKHFSLGDHSFSAYTKFSEKLTFLTP